MQLLVTGGAGYLGSVLIPKLLVRGHRVRVLDAGFFGVGHLRGMQPAVELIREDIRRILQDAEFGAKLLDGCEAVIHLAAISNDPSAELNPALTEEVNFQATVRLAEEAKKRRVRFLFSSSCSLYGAAKEMTDEEGTLAPLTTYAVSKANAEKALAGLEDASWKPVVLRNGTLFGYSPRMRFDLVVNIFSLYSTLYDEIKLFGEGQQWRPFLHVGDCARAFLHFLEKPDCRHRCYNIAHENLRVTDLAALFKRMNPRLKTVQVQGTDDDRRDYRVSTRRMQEEGFQARTGVEAGAQEMCEAIASGLISDPESIYYRNAKWLKELTQIGSKTPKDVVNLMEILEQIHRGPKA